MAIRFGRFCGYEFRVVSTSGQVSGTLLGGGFQNLRILKRLLASYLLSCSQAYGNGGTVKLNGGGITLRYGQYHGATYYQIYGRNSMGVAYITISFCHAQDFYRLRGQRSAFLRSYATYNDAGGGQRYVFNYVFGHANSFFTHSCTRASRRGNQVRGTRGNVGTIRLAFSTSGELLDAYFSHLFGLFIVSQGVGGVVT